MTARLRAPSVSAASSLFSAARRRKGGHGIEDMSDIIGEARRKATSWSLLGAVSRAPMPESSGYTRPMLRRSSASPCCRGSSAASAAGDLPRRSAATAAAFRETWTEARETWRRVEGSQTLVTMRARGEGGITLRGSLF